MWDSHSIAVPNTRRFSCHSCHWESPLDFKASKFQGILTLVDGCWKALEENTTVRTVNDLYTVGRTDRKHAQIFIIATMVLVSATFK